MKDTDKKGGAPRTTPQSPRTRDRKCPSGKVRFRDHEAAVRALHRAANARHFAEIDGESTNRHEVRSYACGLCQGFHLTSQREFNITKAGPHPDGPRPP